MALLYDFIAPLIVPVPLIRANQDGPAPKRPYATYRVTLARDPRHSVTSEPDDAGNVVLRAHRTLSAEVQIYGPGGESAADRLQLALKAETVAQSAERLGLALATVRPAQHVPALLDGQRWEERGIVEFTGYVLAELADNLGLIETVTADGEWRDETGDDMPTVTVTGRPAPIAARDNRGVVSLEFLGAFVEAGLFAVLPSAPYPLTPIAFDHEVGDGGGSFIAELVWLHGADLGEETPAGLPVVGVDAPLRRSLAIPPASRVTLAPGDRLAVRISAIVGEPSGALLSVHFLR